MSLDSYKFLYSLAKQIEWGSKDQCGGQERDSIVQDVSTHVAQLLGEEGGGHSSSTAPPPVQHCTGEQLCVLAWSLSELVSFESRVCSNEMRWLLDDLAVAVVHDSALDRPAHTACMRWSKLLSSVAATGIKSRNSPTVQQLFDVAAQQQFPQMLHSAQQHCSPESLSNAVNAFAAAEHAGTLKHFVSAIAASRDWLKQAATPQVGGFSDRSGSCDQKVLMFEVFDWLSAMLRWCMISCSVKVCHVND